MSTNGNINGTPGLKRVVPKVVPFGIGVKVTGRNLAALSYIISLEAERRGVALKVATDFAADGSLVQVIITDSSRDSEVVLFGGEYVLLAPNANEAVLMDEDYYLANFKEL